MIDNSTNNNNNTDSDNRRELPLTLPATAPSVDADLEEALKAHRWNRNPRPQPRKFSKLVFLMKIQLTLHLSKLVVWVSSSGRGFRFHR